MKKAGKWILILIGAIILVLLLRGFLFTSVMIPSTGMENSLFEGDRILIYKWAYGLRPPFMAEFSYHRWLESPVKAGDIVVFNNPADISQPVIDKRGIYINRCIGVPGDTLKLDSLFNVSSWKKAGPDRKQLFAYATDKEQELQLLLNKLAIKNSTAFGENDSINLRSFSRYEYYLLEQELGNDIWIQPLVDPEKGKTKPLVVPGKGMNIKFHPSNLTIYRNTIILHENQHAEIMNDTLYVDGKAVNSYTFTKDYYWMASDNQINVSDSRLFGFVPHDHIIGMPFVIWMSKDQNTGFIDGYRWNRFFKPVK